MVCVFCTRASWFLAGERVVGTPTSVRESPAEAVDAGIVFDRYLDARVNHEPDGDEDLDAKFQHMDETVDCAMLARYTATVLNGLAVQSAIGATEKELRLVSVLAMQAWPS